MSEPSSNVFDPVLFSLRENQFFLDHLGEPPVVALAQLPAGMNPRAVRPVLEQVYSLIQLQAHDGTPWAGLDAVKDKISIYIKQAERWALDRARNRAAPRFPTMHTYDARKRPHRAGPGSDSGRVRTYFGPAGERIPFAIELVPSEAPEWSPSWAEADKPAKGLTVNETVGRIECDLCGHTESYRVESRGSYNAARGRISKHLRTATQDPDSHRELHTVEFGG